MYGFFFVSVQLDCTHPFCILLSLKAIGCITRIVLLCSRVNMIRQECRLKQLGLDYGSPRDFVVSRVSIYIYIRSLLYEIALLTLLRWGPMLENQIFDSSVGARSSVRQLHYLSIRRRWVLVFHFGGEWEHRYSTRIVVHLPDWFGSFNPNSSPCAECCTYRPIPTSFQK